MQRSLTPYKIGLAVLGLFTLVLVGIVLSSASAKKQDDSTYTAANKIADSLNSYTLLKGRPTSLDAAKIATNKNVSYRTVGADKYEFCVTYRTKSTGFNATDVQTSLLTSAYGGGSSGSSFANDSGESTLYLDATHKKGKNCKTITPDSYNSYSSPSLNYNDSGSSSSLPSTSAYAECDKIPYDQAQAYNDCLKKIDNSKQQAPTTKLN